MRIVFHIDMDAFYAAVEERERPELRGKPVVVGADPKGGKGRGVVSTCSYEARKYGIRSGMPIAWAYKKCPGAIFLLVNMQLYWQVSQQIMEIVRKHAVSFQQMSVDEAFFESNADDYEQAEKIAKKFKQEILEREKLTCSIGIGPNKLVAKIASDFQKPNGLTVVKQKDVKRFLENMPVRKLYGIGPKTEHALTQMGINTIGTLARYSEKRLSEYFGKAGFMMHQYANGMDDSPVEEREEAKSIGREVTFENDTGDFLSLSKVLEEIADDIFNTAKQEGYTFKTVVLKIRFQGFETHTKQKSFKTDTSLEDVKLASRDLLAHYKSEKKKVRLIGLRLTNLEKVKK